MGSIGVSELVVVGLVFAIVIGVPLAALVLFLVLRKKP
jgi:hypothetical protein